MKLALWSLLLIASPAFAQNELSDADRETILKRMNEHAFSVYTEGDELTEGTLLFANDSVVALWVDNDSIVDFNRLDETTITMFYYDVIKSIEQGTSYKSKVFAYRVDIFGDYVNYSEALPKLQKLSLYRWFIPEPLIDYAEESLY